VIMAPKHDEIVRHQADGWAVAWDANRIERSMRRAFDRVIAENASALKEVLGRSHERAADRNDGKESQAKRSAAGKRTSVPSDPARSLVHMATPNKRTVTPRSDGWSVEKPGASRASSVHPTQQQAIDAARRTLSNSGGGELAIKGRDGKVRAQDTVAPGNDPRRSRG
jgi:hypothetical protein